MRALWASRTTVRQALARLEQRGLIEPQGPGHVRPGRRPGLVAAPVVRRLLPGRDRPHRAQVTSQILRAEREPLPAWACAALELRWARTGRRSSGCAPIDGLVALYVVNHLPERLADAALSVLNPNESLYRRLKSGRGHSHGGRRTSRPSPPTPRLAELLELEPGAPVAFIESLGWDEDSPVRLLPRLVADRPHAHRHPGLRPGRGDHAAARRTSERGGHTSLLAGNRAAVAAT